MNESDEPKIIVDDDWKEQVQREKEELEKQDPSSPDEHALPEASIGLLITTLTTQALSALGFIPDPASGKPITNRPMAKHFVDTLTVLQEKTAGNLTEDEAQLLNESLHQLRMAYVSAGQAATAESDADNDSTAGSNIELP